MSSPSERLRREEDISKEVIFKIKENISDSRSNKNDKIQILTTSENLLV